MITTQLRTPFKDRNSISKRAAARLLDRAVKSSKLRLRDDGGISGNYCKDDRRCCAGPVEQGCYCTST
jgi:hypothetical protein